MITNEQRTNLEKTAMSVTQYPEIEALVPAFLRDWLRGSGDCGYKRNDYFGLCLNFCRWLKAEQAYDYECSVTAYRVLGQIFRSQGLNPVHPFGLSRSCRHSAPLREAWVATYLAEHP